MVLRLQIQPTFGVMFETIEARATNEVTIEYA